ncbi:MAG: hypothetical protein ABR570_02785 [Burkholderiales bacterium]
MNRQVTLANWREAPYSRSAFQHVRGLLATADVAHVSRRPRLFAYGIHGQNLFVHCKNELVVAKISSQAMPIDAARISLALRTVSQIRRLASG